MTAAAPRSSSATAERLSSSPPAPCPSRGRTTRQWYRPSSSTPATIRFLDQEGASPRGRPQFRHGADVDPDLEGAGGQQDCHRDLGNPREGAHHFGNPRRSRRGLAVLPAQGRDTGEEQAGEPTHPSSRGHHVQVGRGRGQNPRAVRPAVPRQDRRQGEQQRPQGCDPPPGWACSLPAGKQQSPGDQHDAQELQPPTRGPGRSGGNREHVAEYIVREEGGRLMQQANGQQRDEDAQPQAANEQGAVSGTTYDVLRCAGPGEAAQNQEPEGDGAEDPQDSQVQTEAIESPAVGESGSGFGGVRLRLSPGARIDRRRQRNPRARPRLQRPLPRSRRREVRPGTRSPRIWGGRRGRRWSTSRCSRPRPAARAAAAPERRGGRRPGT